MNKRKAIALAITAAIALTAIAARVNFHRFEDDSWALGNYPYLVTGCPSGGYGCTVPGFAVCATWADNHGLNTQYLTDHDVPVADCTGIVEFGE